MTDLQSRAVEYLRTVQVASVTSLVIELNHDRKSALMCVAIMQRCGQIVRSSGNLWTLGQVQRGW
jgi:hypothetical protein